MIQSEAFSLWLLDCLTHNTENTHSVEAEEISGNTLGVLTYTGELVLSPIYSSLCLLSSSLSLQVSEKKKNFYKLSKVTQVIMCMQFLHTILNYTVAYLRSGTAFHGYS